MALSGLGKNDEASRAFHHALTISPDYLPALEGAAQIEYNRNGKETVPLLEHVLKLQPNDPTSHAMLGVLAYKRGECGIAMQQFEKSGSILESQPAAMHQFGICLLKAKQTEKATLVFQRLLELQPDDSQARMRLATVQLAAERPTDALATLQPLLQSNPDMQVLELTAAAYEANHDTPEAVKALRQAITLEPRNVDLYVDFANLSFVHQSFQVGIDMINFGLSLQPQSAVLYLARGVLFVQLANYDQAEADFQRADELDPHLALTGAAQGMIAQEKNDLDQALATTRSKLAKRPNDPLLMYMQAQILADKNPDPGSPEYKQAIEVARKAVALQPGVADAHDILAKLYLQGGQNQLAVEQCRQALRADPKHQSALYHLIIALRNTGQKAELPELLKRLAQLRQEATREEGERNRFKLVEEHPGLSQPAQP